MKYYRWEGVDPWLEDRNEHWMIDVPIDLPSLCRNDGKRVRRWNPKLIAVYPEHPIAIDFSIAAGEYPVFSNRLRKFFELTYPKLIQFLPIRLEADDGTSRMAGYSFGKFLVVLECIDRRRTTVADDDWTMTGNGMYNTRGPLYLRESAIRGAVCFLVRGQSQHVVIREDLERELRRRRFLGCRFDALCVSADL